MSPSVTLRPVISGDLPIFFEHQNEPEAIRMAAFPARSQEDFTAHWSGRILGNRAVVVRAIIADGVVAGNLVAWTQEGERFVGYWLGRDQWGRGIATAALSLFLKEVSHRPLRARAARHNLGSIRVLQKCGFVAIGEDHFIGPEGEPVEEIHFRLSAPTSSPVYCSPPCSMPEIEEGLPTDDGPGLKNPESAP